MSVVSPYEDAAAWDAVQIVVSRNGKSNVYSWAELPVDFDGDVTNEWDVKKAKGADGAKATDNGYTPSQFSMRWLLHKPEHFKVYEAFVADAKPRPGKEPKPTLVIVHPLLQMYNLTICNLEKIHFLEAKAVDQWEARIDLVEWFPAPKPVKKDATPASEARNPERPLYDTGFFSSPGRERPQFPSEIIRGVSAVEVDE